MSTPFRTDTKTDTGITKVKFSFNPSTYSHANSLCGITTHKVDNRGRVIVKKTKWLSSRAECDADQEKFLGMLKKLGDVADEPI